MWLYISKMGVTIGLSTLLLGLFLIGHARTRRFAPVFALCWAALALIVCLLKVPVAMDVLEFETGRGSGLSDLLKRSALVRMVIWYVPMEALFACGLSAGICAVMSLRWRLGRRSWLIAATAVGLVAMVGSGAYQAWFVGTIRHMERRTVSEARLYPDRAGVQLEYANLLLRHRRSTDALAVTRHAYELDTDRLPDYPLAVGQVYLAMGRPADAIDPLGAAYNLALKWQPPPDPLLKMLGRSVENADVGQQIAARKRFWDSSRRQQERSTGTAFVVALILTERWGQSTDVSRQLASRFPDQARLVSRYALLLMAVDDPSASAQLASLNRATSPDQRSSMRWVKDNWEPAKARKALQSWAQEYCKNLMD